MRTAPNQASLPGRQHESGPSSRSRQAPTAKPVGITEEGGRRGSRPQHAGHSLSPASRSPPPIRAQTVLTPAEAYASAHQSGAAAAVAAQPLASRGADELGQTGAGNKKRVGGDSRHAVAVSAGKPLFDWLTRKLGGRRASIADGLNVATAATSATASSKGSFADRYGTLPRSSVADKSAPRDLSNSWTMGAQRSTSPVRIRRDPVQELQQTPARQSSLGRSESHSLHSFLYPTRQPSERRRQANNPYPSLPVPPAHRESTIDSSLMSRSRTPSLNSVNSFTSSPARMSMAYPDEEEIGSGSMLPNSPLSRFRHSRALSGADEDASLLAFPPSLPGSPVPAGSIMSHSTPVSLASPYVDSFPARDRSPRPRRLFQPRRRSSAASEGLEEQSNSSSDARDELDACSRRDSSSTKPTTVLSFDSGPHVAHIAQAPPTVAIAAVPVPAPAVGQELVPSPAASPQLPMTPTTPTPMSMSHPPSPMVAQSSRMGPPPQESGSPRAVVQAPKRSAPHPRDNPHPSSPPAANASTLTLASSTFAAPQNAFGSSWTPNAGSPLFQSPHIGAQPRLSASQGLAESSRAAQAVKIATRNRNLSIGKLSLGPAGASASVPASGRDPLGAVNGSDAMATTSPSVSVGASSAHGQAQGSGPYQPRPSSLLATAPVALGRPEPGPSRDRPASTVDSQSLYSYSYAPSLHPTMATSLRTGNWAGGGRYGMADRDASVRALRRKGSWESYESGWSWKGGSAPAPAAGPAPPSGSIPSKPTSVAEASSSRRRRDSGLPRVTTGPASELPTSDFERREGSAPDSRRDSQQSRSDRVNPGEDANGHADPKANDEHLSPIPPSASFRIEHPLDSPNSSTSMAGTIGRESLRERHRLMSPSPPAAASPTAPASAVMDERDRQQYQESTSIREPLRWYDCGGTRWSGEIAAGT